MPIDYPEDIINLENASVCYHVPRERMATFKEYAIRWLQGKLQYQSFWALKDVSFSVRQGEVFGLIGKNGAGKSTLLKLVARVLRPTQGRVMVRGRVAPLLEMGAGFHPELSGRENVYLNGAMLGVGRQEIDHRLDQIVDFAELWDFIDFPLRTYSSGMWARLGFAVATDRRPDILIVDEVLSVGDVAFQFKCMKRIESFREQGTSILMVSHNYELIERMCQRAALLENGRLVEVGPAKEAINRYLGRAQLSEDTGPAHPELVPTEQRWGNRKIEITGVRLLDGSGQPRADFNTGETLVVEITYVSHRSVDSAVFGIGIHRKDGIHVSGPNTATSGLDLGWLDKPGKILYTIPVLPLLQGEYLLSVAATNREDTELYDYHNMTYSFQVMPGQEKFGVVSLAGTWKHSPA